jgi:hypothetical protein
MGSYQNLTLCPGRNFDLFFTLVNNGTTSATAPFLIYMANFYTDWHSSQGTMLLTATATVSAYGYFTSTANVTIPTLPPGTYWVYTTMEPCLNTEWRCDDNSVYLDMTITIPSGC